MIKGNKSIFWLLFFKKLTFNKSSALCKNNFLSHQKILRGIHEKLGINSETKTDDGKISLGYSTCLGACAQAPLYAINHELKGNASVEKIMNTINILK